MKKCSCKDWDKEIAQINSVFVLAALHGMQINSKEFIFCPYCGKKLNDT